MELLCFPADKGVMSSRIIGHHDAGFYSDGDIFYPFDCIRVGWGCYCGMVGSLFCVCLHVHSTLYWSSSLSSILVVTVFILLEPAAADVMS